MLDYVNFDFDNEGVLTALNAPLAFDPQGGTVAPDEPGYRDSLCSLIKKSVIKTNVTADAIVVIFDDQSRLEVPLTEAPIPPGEKALFSRKGSELWVW